MEKRLFTSECVTCGHPDKVADAISDAILDACLAQDPGSRVACETMVTTDFCLICGEITTKAVVDYPAVAREAIRKTLDISRFFARIYTNCIQALSRVVEGTAR